MAGKHNTMGETVEKSFAASGLSDKVDAEKSATVDNGESNKNPRGGDAKEEKEGSLKDYFASQKIESNLRGAS
jgi:hypothetical protein